MLGAVMHTVNVRLSAEQVLYTIDHAEDDFILVNSEFLPILDQIKGRIDTVKGYVVLVDDELPDGSSIPLAGEYEELLAGSDDEFDFQDFDENTRATTFYTTGTTGMPKGVYFSHRQLVLHTLATLAALSTATEQGRFNQQDVYMPITPMFHVHAWGFPYIATAGGVKQVYPGKYIPNNLLHFLDSECVTFSHCVPTILHMLMASPEFEKLDLSRWKVVIGGAAMPKKLCQAAKAKGIDIFSGYGMSETCPVLTLSHVGNEELSDEEDTEIRCKTGRPLPLVQLRVVDEQMQDVPSDGESVGEIVVRAPWLTQGIGRIAVIRKIFGRGGFLHTGDVAHLNDCKYVNITDRMKDVIKVGGEWLSSLELEGIINLHSGVSEVAVIGMADDKWGEKPLALIVVKADSEEPTAKEITGHVRSFIDKGMMSKLALLLSVRFVDVIDKTSIGKNDKKRAEEKFLS